MATECQAKISEAIKIWGELFFKSSKLDREEQKEMEAHTVLGGARLKLSKCQFSQKWPKDLA